MNCNVNICYSTLGGVESPWLLQFSLLCSPGYFTSRDEPAQNCTEQLWTKDRNRRGPEHAPLLFPIRVESRLFSSKKTTQQAAGT